MDTDIGAELLRQVDDLEQLMAEYKKGTIKEVFNDPKVRKMWD